MLVVLLGLLCCAISTGWSCPWQKVREVEANLFGYVEEWLNGTEALQTSRGAPYVLERLATLSRSRWRANVSADGPIWGDGPAGGAARLRLWPISGATGSSAATY